MRSRLPAVIAAFPSRLVDTADSGFNDRIEKLGIEVKSEVSRRGRPHLYCDERAGSPKGRDREPFTPVPGEFQTPVVFVQTSATCLAT